jgi:hypothetical protein
MTTSISFDCNDTVIAKKVQKVTETEIKRLSETGIITVERRGSIISVKSLIQQDIDALITRVHHFAHGACNALERYGK